jgi:hypothetical protein
MVTLLLRVGCPIMANPNTTYIYNNDKYKSIYPVGTKMLVPF